MKVKWGKEMYPGVEVNTDYDPDVFKAQIFALTGVQPERQKVVCKGVTLRDDGWGNFKLTNVSKFIISNLMNVKVCVFISFRFMLESTESICRNLK